MKIKVSEATNLQLDWAVKEIEDGRTDGIKNYSPSTSWAQGGPIIERERINISDDGGDGWKADDSIGHWGYGPTPLLAAMRCYVASKLGEEVEIPEELK
jgi:hypothetical protein